MLLEDDYYEDDAPRPTRPVWRKLALGSVLAVLGVSAVAAVVPYAPQVAQAVGRVRESWDSPEADAPAPSEPAGGDDRERSDPASIEDPSSPVGDPLSDASADAPTGDETPATPAADDSPTEEQTGTTPPAAPAIAVVQTHTVVESSESSLSGEYAGTLRATRAGEVVAPDGGRVERLLIEEGAVVRRGQLLAEVGALELRDEIEALEARRASGSGDRAAESELQLRRLRARLKRARLVAPYDAVVARLVAEEGATVEPGKPVVRLVENAPPEAVVGVPPEVAMQRAPGETVRVTVAGADRVATVKSVLPEFDAETLTRTVVLQLEAPPGENALAGLAVGEPVLLHLPRPAEHRGYWLPADALVEGPDGAWSAYLVEAVDQPGAGPTRHVLRRISLEFVRLEGDRALVRGSLGVGDVFAVRSGAELSDGQRVRPGALQGNGAPQFNVSKPIVP